MPKLIQIVRQDGLDLLAARAPETRGQDGAARLKTAARLTGLRPRELLQAFTGAGGHAARVHSGRARAGGVPPSAHAVQQTGGQPSRAHPAAAAARPGTDRRRDHKMRAEFDKAFREAREGDKEHA